MFYFSYVLFLCTIFAPILVSKLIIIWIAIICNRFLYTQDVPPVWFVFHGDWILYAGVTLLPDYRFAIFLPIFRVRRRVLCHLFVGEWSSVRCVKLWLDIFSQEHWRIIVFPSVHFSSNNLAYYYFFL